MAFKEAMFWLGMTILGAGLYFVFEVDKRAGGVAFILLGLIVSGYSVYRHHYPDAPKRPWLALGIVLTWIAIGYDFYDRHSMPPPREFDARVLMDEGYGQSVPDSCFMDVNGKTLMSLNKGYKAAVGCFVYDGTRPILDAPHVQVGNLYDITDSDMHLVTTWGTAFNDYLAQGKAVGINVALLLIPNGVQPSQFTTLRQARALGVRIPEIGTAKR